MLLMSASANSKYGALASTSVSSDIGIGEDGSTSSSRGTASLLRLVTYKNVIVSYFNKM